MPPFTRLIACTTTLLFLTACGNGSDNQVAIQPVYDFAALDARFQQFLDESAAFEGISVVLVDAQQGAVHEAAFGDHTLDQCERILYSVQLEGSVAPGTAFSYGGSQKHVGEVL